MNLRDNSDLICGHLVSNAPSASASADQFGIVFFCLWSLSHSCDERNVIMAEQVCADLDRMASEINKLLEFAELALDAKSLKHAFRGLMSVAEAKSLALLAYDRLNDRHSAGNEERYKELFKRAETLIRAYQATFSLAFLVGETAHTIAPVARVIRHVETAQRTGKKLNAAQKQALIRTLKGGRPSGVTDRAWYKLLGQEYGISHFTVKYYADTYTNGG